MQMTDLTFRVKITFAEPVDPSLVQAVAEQIADMLEAGVKETDFDTLVPGYNGHWVEPTGQLNYWQEDDRD